VWRKLHLLVAASVFAGVVAAVPASAGVFPSYDGAMSFPLIHGSSDPEEYSWEVQLADGQGLEQVDAQDAAVYYVDDHVRAFVISAEAAHDAEGSTVPTTLSVSGSNVITLTVHHRAGDSDAGTPFVYPVAAGGGWEGGGGTVVVVSPKDEQEEREELKRRAKEAQEATQARDASGNCLVPRLKGRSLKASRRSLREADCKLGEVRRENTGPKGGKVVRQSPRPGAVLARGANVRVTLGVVSTHRSPG